MTTAPAPLFQWHTYTPGHYETPEAPPPPPPSTGTPGPWTELTALATASSLSQGRAAAIGADLYLVDGNNPSPLFYRYTPATGTLTRLADRPSSGYAPNVVAIGGKVYVFGYTEAYVYDPAANTWTARAAMPFPVIFAACGVIGGKLYVAGGTGNADYNKMQVYDPAANTWTLGAPMPVATALFFTGEVLGGQLHTFGGLLAGSVSAAHYAYDPATNTWATKAPLPARRRSGATAALNGATIYAGGASETGASSTAAYSYDPATDAWAALAAMPHDIRNDGFGAAVGDDFYAFGVGAGGLTTVTRWHTVPTTPPAPPAPVPVWVPGGYALDAARSAALVSWATAYGRDDAFTRTDPVQVTVALDAPLAGACPVGGDRFRLTLDATHPAAVGLTADQRARFTGEVTDAVIDPRGGLYTVTAVGRLGRARRRTLNGTGWPRELDGVRVTRILDLAARDTIPGTRDAGASTLIAATSSAQAAGALLDLVVDSTGGQVIEQPTGAVDYHDADHRRGATVAVTLTPAEILNELVWSQHVGDIVNEVEVVYGPLGDKVTARDRDSILALEAFPTSLTTALSSASDAYDVGNLLTARRSVPRWQLPNLVVDLRATVTPAKAAALLKLRHGDRIAVDALPAGGPYTGRVELFVEGYTEVATRRAWTLALAVSDPRLSGVGVRWKDVSPTLTWDGVKATLSWLDTALLENPADLAP